MKTNLQKLTTFLSAKSNWCKGSYSRQGAYCIIGAIGHLIAGKEEIHLKDYLAAKLGQFISAKNLKVDTGKYALTLATFNDNTDHETVVEFLNYAAI